jgi:ABC-type phosphate transport system substrate-binding protein
MSAQEIGGIYLKKRRFWDGGDPIVPLNREASSAARETFSRRVLGGGSAAFVGYWNDQYFHGVFPPTTLSSSDAVKRYVAADRNAIGYIWSTEVDDSVRVLLRVE